MRIVGFLKGRNGVGVKDILALSGAEKLRVYPILFELEQEGMIKVVRRKGLGVPDVVVLEETDR